MHVVMRDFLVSVKLFSKSILFISELLLNHLKVLNDNLDFLRGASVGVFQLLHPIQFFLGECAFLLLLSFEYRYMQLKVFDLKVEDGAASPEQDQLWREVSDVVKWFAIGHHLLGQRMKHKKVG